MSDPATSRTGSCLCGAVQVRIQGKPLEMHLCHCTICQKLTGSAFGAYVTVQDQQLTVTVKPGHDEESTLKSYKEPPKASGNVNTRTFCGICSSLITCRNTSLPVMVVVPLGILEPYPLSGDGATGAEGRGGEADDAWNAKPTIEYWCERKRSWVGETGAELVLPRQPEREEEVAKLKKIFGME
ncbi:hypothetical protein PG996_012928 [Apiospora saccharicola]|uniref:CENP-V/GFA domain-containing protein n=1 Tax=Apiospora saccharicola TaxID=335842 RepID=A0ABR1U425_9PEZI